MPLQYSNAPTYGVPNNVTAATVALDIHTAVENEFYDYLYPDREWYDIVTREQLKTDVNAGATSFAYIMRNLTGAAAFIGNGPNNNIPMVGQSIGAVQVPIAYAAVGSEITNEDARQYSFGFNANLAQDLGMAMREALDNLMETSIIFGVPELNFEGWINYTGVQVDTAAVGAGGTTPWNTKTGEEMCKDVNDALTSVWEDSRTIFKPLDVFLPLAQFALLSETPMVIGSTGAAISALEYLAKNNIMYRITGQELRLHPSRYLAGAGALGVDRMVVMDRSERNQILPFPMPYRLTQPIPVPLGVKWFAEEKFGSYHIRQAGSVRYVDGI